ncbi:MAG: hypothetical protein WBL06_05795 [Pseudolysinimonas sp.]|uniref:hypothetical protein n=1 Tax=Pseudolysinimonas sp. TaxID=2680009 RepID=UPI003C75B582
MAQWHTTPRKRVYPHLPNHATLRYGECGGTERDLAQRAPGHSLIEKLLDEWNQGRIHFGGQPDTVEIDEDARGWYWGALAG